MDQKGTNDLEQLFHALGKNTWQTAASRAVPALVSLEPFYLQIFTLCKNGLIPRASLRDALIQIDHEVINGHRLRRWNWSYRPVIEGANRLSEVIRIGASKLRELKTNAVVFSRAMKDASLEDKKSINRLLESLVIDTCPGTSNVAAPSTCATVDEWGCCMGIFERIMAEGLDKPLLQCGSRESLLSTTSVATSVRATSSPGPMKSDSNVPACPPLTMGQLQRLKTLRSPPDKHTCAASHSDTPSRSRSSLVSTPRKETGDPTATTVEQECKREVATQLFSNPESCLNIADRIIDLSNLRGDGPGRKIQPTRRRPRNRAVGSLPPQKKEIVKAPSEAATTAPRRSRWVGRNWKGNKLRNCQCRAYRQAFKKAKAGGHGEETARATARAAYHEAGIKYLASN